MYEEHKRSWTVRTSPELIAYKVPTFSCPSIDIIPKWNGTKSISENLLVANKIALRSQVLHDARTKIIAMVIIESTRRTISFWRGPSPQPRNEKYFPRYDLRTHDRCDLIYQIMYIRFDVSQTSSSLKYREPSNKPVLLLDYESGLPKFEARYDSS